MNAPVISWAIPAGMSVSQGCALAAAAGFDAVELGIDSGGPLTLDTPGQVCRDWARAASQAGVSASGVVMSTDESIHFCAKDREARNAARMRVRAAIDRAAELGAGMAVVTTAVVCAGEAPAGGVRYEDAYHRALDALSELRFHAETRGVGLACRCATGGFLLSPMETRDFIDRINSAWVGASVDVAGVRRFGDAGDWIRTLGRRSMRSSIRRTDVAEGDDRSVRAVLATGRFRGVVVCESEPDSEAAYGLVRDLLPDR